MWDKSIYHRILHSALVSHQLQRGCFYGNHKQINQGPFKLAEVFYLRSLFMIESLLQLWNAACALDNHALHFSANRPFAFSLGKKQNNQNSAVSER